ncbi:DEAD/DEAH box helicase [Vibrio cyclitrophicus]|uniref:Helicase n=2 Tax=Vibrio cyclitrophicus TaxID=47951 RepID=A0A7Z1S2L9_9VIBR|nr:DEAD/DEAH box helicase [Vibrio cyclitrophicus]PMP23052.1 helicase [Vibrio cyclitrophicus]PMP29532.1 helicase [Vibrio cyclitrophicus]
MVDFAKLRTQKNKATPIDPLEIFRRLPKPLGINDLYTSQAEVLSSWFEDRNDRDTVLKLHTGGGKTLVGLLMAQSTMNETKEPVLYLAPTRQLVNQTIEKAKNLGIPAVPYQRGKELNDSFLNAKSIMVATYQALFNGKSKFGVRGGHKAPIKLGAVILDDAHVAFPNVRESFTITIPSNELSETYQVLASLFRKSFISLNKEGTFDDVISRASDSILEVPYWAWHEQSAAARELLRNQSEEYFPLVWPLLRDNLHLCHVLVSKNAITISPILPLMNEFPSFDEAPRRIYMSATIADDSEIIRTFDAEPKLVKKALTSRSLAGISERMILIPDLMPFDFNVRETIDALAIWAAKAFGVVILSPSDKAAETWKDIAIIAKGSKQAEGYIEDLQSRTLSGPIAFANRYDGVDLPGDSCRLLIMEGLPAGTSDYELFRAATLYGGESIIRMLAQRIEQGIGRGARGAGDHCVVILSGASLASWIAKDANFDLLTSATRAQIEMGSTISREVSDLHEFAETMNMCFRRSSDWVEYHAESLAENIEEEHLNSHVYDLAASERKAFKLWQDGYPDKAIARLDKAASNENIDHQTKGWLLQTAANIANHWGQIDRAEALQREAYANNRNLQRPQITPPYRPLPAPCSQAEYIVQQLGEYRLRKGFINKFEDVVSHLHSNATANQFEQAFESFGKLIGLVTERHDYQGEGPDLLCLLPNSPALVIEAKSRKKNTGVFNKDNHGQLLIAGEWFESNYPGQAYCLVSIHPTNKATKAANASNSYAFTYDKLITLINDARALLTKLCNSQLSNSDLLNECAMLLDGSSIRSDKIVSQYLTNFTSQ